MERGLIVLQKIGKVLPYLVMGVLVLAAAALSVYEWKKPALIRLETKDPHRYELMVKEALRLNWGRAWNQYRALKAISTDELYQERYARWKQRWETDPLFRQEVLRQKADVQKQLRQSQKKKYEAWTLELERPRIKPDVVLRKVHWEQATPWQKSLILRDGCVRYLSQEIEDYRNRRHVRGSLKGAAVQAHPRTGHASPGSLCREMVSLSHDAPSVNRALLRLQKEMNHYYFVRLLEDAGIPDSEWFSVSSKLEGMTRDFNGY